MADDIQLNQAVGTPGATIAADEIGSVHHQRVKVQYGPDGSATDVSVATPMPTRDFTLDIARGQVTGYSVVNKFGRNTAVASGATEEIWDGSYTYPFPTSATITHIRSAVDSATTQGVTVEVQGLDANWDLTVQNVTTDGTDSTTEVALTTPLIRVFRMRVLDAAVMDQNLWLGDSDMSGATDTEAVIIAGKNQTQMAIYTVPAGYTAFLTNYYAREHPVTGNSATSLDVELWATDNANGYAKQLKHSMGLSVGQGAQHNFNPYLKFTEKTDIYLTLTTVGGTSDMSGGFDIILVNE